MERNRVQEVLAKVAEYYGVSKETIETAGKRTQSVIRARLALFVSLEFLGLPNEGVIKCSRTLPQWFLASGLSDFQTLRSFREEVRDIVSVFDEEAFIENANRYPHVTDMVRERMRSMMIKPLRRGQKFSEIKERVIRANYTQAENRAIENACRSAEAFMSRYGEGTKEMPMLRGYERGLYNSLNEDKR